MSILLCDVGGTHIRFSLSRNGRIEPHKMRVDQHPKLQDAIVEFLASQNTQAESVTAFYLAFSNRNQWNTHPDEIRSALPKAIIRQVNDFEANAHGVISADKSDFMLLNKPSGETVVHSSKIVMGVGTGLGFAYICNDKGREFIQRTHGAHMLPVYAPEHEELYKFVMKDSADALIYEDVLAGRGLFSIYKYLSQRNHLDIEYADAEIMMRDGRDNPVFRQALDIFHELLGLFAHQAVAFGYSYGGIYLTGGVIDRLMLAGLFNIDKFMTSFVQKNVSVVVHDVLATPVFWIKDEFVSLKGLQHLAQEDGHHA